MSSIRARFHFAVQCLGAVITVGGMIVLLQAVSCLHFGPLPATRPLDSLSVRALRSDYSHLFKGGEDHRKGRRIEVTGVVVSIQHSDLFEGRLADMWFVTLGEDLKDRGFVSCEFQHRPIVDVGDAVTVRGTVDTGGIALTKQISLVRPVVVQRSIPAPIMFP